MALPAFVRFLPAKILGLGLLRTAPANQFGLELLERAANWGSFLELTARHAYIFVRGFAARNLPVGALLFLASLLLSSCIHEKRESDLKIELGAIGLAAAVLGLASLSLILAAMTPFSYVQSSYPPARQGGFLARLLPVRLWWPRSPTYVQR